jgi:hypothetical protein
MESNQIEKTSFLSEDGKYLYELTQVWDATKKRMMFLTLNPSTVDIELDKTVKRCVGFAREWGWGGVVIGNLFAFRADDPKELAYEPNPIGQMNDRFIVGMAEDAGLVVLGWGNDGAYKGRSHDVARLLINAGYQLTCLDTTLCNEPRHPLYLPKFLKPKPYTR